MSNRKSLPWSFYSSLASFGVFFACINIYIITKWLGHPWASDLWLVGVIIGLVWLIFSIWMVRRHQKELVKKKTDESRVRVE
jgi:type VI protein secretion system component VasK